MGLILGGNRKQDPVFSSQTFGKNALRIALNLPQNSGLQLDQGT